ncbi:MAG: hypothetical protein IKH18_02505 [Clostridia bacterium]|nr:hypothetical protein [Clostridia bacterium]
MVNTQLLEEFKQHLWLGMMLEQYEVNIDDIFKSLDKKEEKYISFVRTLANYGVYDLLSLILFVVDFLCSEGTSDWLKEELSDVPGHDFLFSTAEAFHNYRMDDFRRRGNVYTGSVAHVEEQTWKSYDKDKMEFASYNLRMCAGLMLPALYLQDDERPSNYLKTLTTLVLPGLIVLLRDYQNERNDPWKEKVLKRLYCKYLKEIEFKYTVMDLNYCVGRMKYEELHTMAGQEIKETYFSHQGKIYPFMDYSEEWLVNLNSFMDCADRYLHEETKKYTEKLSEYMPFLYIILDKDREAEAAFYKCIDRHHIWHSKYFSFIAVNVLLKPVDMAKHDVIVSQMKRIFGNEEYNQRYIDLLEDTINYFKTIFREVSKEDILPDKEWYDNYVNPFDAFAVKYLMKDNRLISTFEHYKGEIQRATSVDENIDPIYSQCINLFYSLSHHIDDLPRINANNCLSLLGYTNDSVPHDKNEVLYHWKYGQYSETIKNLYRRYAELESDTIPYPVKENIRKLIRDSEEKAHPSGLIEDMQRAFLTMMNYAYSDDENYEDFFNDRLADLLRQNRLLDIHREERKGVSLSMKRAGEADITAYRDQKPYAIIEGEMQKENSINKRDLIDHLYKIWNCYNLDGAAFLSLVQYVTNAAASEKYSQIIDTVNDNIGKVTQSNKIVLDEVPIPDNTKLFMYKGTLEKNSKETEFVLFVVNLAMKEQLKEEKLIRLGK